MLLLLLLFICVSSVDSLSVLFLLADDCRFCYSSVFPQKKKKKWSCVPVCVVLFPCLCCVCVMFESEGKGRE